MTYNYLKIIPFLFLSYLIAQEKPVETVYFGFDEYTLYDQQIKNIFDFVKKSDSTKIESIQIYGYCDDRGNNDYNYREIG